MFHELTFLGIRNRKDGVCLRLTEYKKYFFGQILILHAARVCPTESSIDFKSKHKILKNVLVDWEEKTKKTQE